MKKLNFDIIAKALILLAFSLFYLKIIFTDEIMLYVHPRIIPFAIFGLLAMFIIALFLLTNSFNYKKKKFKIKNYIVFLAPLILVFFMETINANSAIKNNTTDINENFNNETTTINNTINSTSELYNNLTETSTQETTNKKALDIENNVIKINQRNFVFSLNEIIENADKYYGKEIEVTGFVYRDNNIKENEFVIGRFMMVCCAADMQIVGIRCDSNNLEPYENDTWIKVKGKLKKDTFEGKIDPIIVAEHIEKDLNPNTSYVYPF